MEVLLITQARMGSSRLPGKVLLEAEGKSLLEIHLRRIMQATLPDEVVLATTTNEQDRPLQDVAAQVGVRCFTGSENDVLDRFYQTALLTKPEWVSRVTADCPLIDPQLIDEVISFCKQHNADYCSNTLEGQYPDGQDIEVFRFSHLEKAWREATLPSEREHVTPYIRKHFNCLVFPAKQNFSGIRMTVDEPRDFDLIKLLVEKLGTDKTWLEYADYIIQSNLLSINQHIKRNEGYIKSLLEDNL